MKLIKRIVIESEDNASIHKVVEACIRLRRMCWNSASGMIVRKDGIEVNVSLEDTELSLYEKYINKKRRLRDEVNREAD